MDKKKTYQPMDFHFRLNFHFGIAIFHIPFHPFGKSQKKWLKVSKFKTENIIIQMENSWETGQNIFLAQRTAVTFILLPVGIFLKEG